jgi:signal transduction histidine kinase
MMHSAFGEEARVGVSDTRHDLAPSEPEASTANPNASANERIFVQFANDGERVASLGRMLFCGLTLVWMVSGIFHAPARPAAMARVLVDIPILTVLCVASLMTFRAARHRRLRSRHLVAWGVIDAVAAFCVLLIADVLAPYPGHPGFGNAPGISALCLIVFVNAFRLMPRASVVAGGLHLVFTLILVLLDYVVNDRIGRETVYTVTLVFVASVLAYGGARGARRLAERASAEATRAERAKDHVGLILQQHHDLRTLLSSTRLNAELLVAGSDVERAQRAEKVVRSVVELSEFVETVKRQSLCELARFDGLAEVDVPFALRHVIDAARHRFQGHEIQFRMHRPSRAVVVGGYDAFARCALNLLANACEGDGTRRATRIRVRYRTIGARVLFQVLDDGPGFASSIGRGLSTKTDGTGLGLQFSRTIVEASGGSMTLSNLANGGARVTCWFSASDRSPVS